MDFNVTFNKAQSWLPSEKFHYWLCYCYGVFQNGGNNSAVNKNIDSFIYLLIINDYSQFKKKERKDIMR